MNIEVRESFSITVFSEDMPRVYASLVVQGCKESACNAGDLDSNPGLGRSPGEENGNPLQYSCLGNPMDWRTAVNGVTKSQTRLSS